MFTKMSKIIPTKNKRKMTFILLFLASVVFITACQVNHSLPSTEKNELSYDHIAKAIKAKYDQELDNLPANKASHYAARIYRISGDTSYLDYNLRDLEVMRKKVEKLLQVAQDSHEVEYSKKRADAWPPKLRTDLRRESLVIAPAFTYYLNSLGVLRQALEYRICGSQFDRLKQHVLAHDYTRDLSDPLMIKAWAAQLANVVVWIKQLGGKDYSELFINAMQQVYPDNQDHLLGTQQYGNKIYGLTHIILAESQYYQYKINRDDYAWVFDYFDHNIDVIVSRTKADVVAEVGVAYLMAGENDHPALDKTKQNIAQQFNETHHMTPSVDGNFDIPSGAHRNILAIVLLSSPRQFYPGPWLSQISDTEQLPKGMYSCFPL
jgi:hypothetical protein